MIDKADYVLATGAITSPVWWQYLEFFGAAYAIAGGAILLTLRMLIAYREWKRGNKE